MRDADLVWQRDQVVIVTLQDGRVLEGPIVRYEDYYECAGVRFAKWEAEEILLQP